MVFSQLARKFYLNAPLSQSRYWGLHLCKIKSKNVKTYDCFDGYDFTEATCLNLQSKGSNLLPRLYHKTEYIDVVFTSL